ncbi:ty3-gypsy retrotransposon protein, partial [Tanacetum coccineum]
HIVSHEGFAVDPSKVTSIQEWPLPKNIKQLCGFLGLARYYRRFVACYASLAAPLTHLLCKDAFIWTDVATVAFNNLTAALTNTPVMALPDFSKPFIIQTDASGSGVWAVLSQDGHPFAYFTMKRWRQYLLGHPFSIQTDHQSLRSLLSQTVQTPEQYKWLTKLLGYDFTITYRPRKENRPADALSRVSHGTLHALQAVTKPICILLDALRQYLEHDSECIYLVKAIAACPLDYPHHSVRDGLLFYKNQILILDNSALQPIVLAEYHSSPVGGHAGMQRTLAHISSTFYWPRMKDAIRDYVLKCRICQETKPFNQAPQGLLQPLQIPGQI